MANGTVQLLLKALQAKLSRSVASHKPIAKLPHLAAESPCRILGYWWVEKKVGAARWAGEGEIT